MRYLITTPWWLRKIYSACVWSLPTKEKIIYLTFDDGPHPVATNFVLEQLAAYNARATFFCIGKNVAAQQQVYQKILDAGHAVGNHTFNHLNGWKTADDVYLNDIAAAKKYIDTNLFRPPYGKITTFQLQLLKAAKFQLKTVMWSVLSGDFDSKISTEKCLQNVLKNTKPGGIVVFHDSEKAFERLAYALPKTLEYFKLQGYRFEKIV